MTASCVIPIDVVVANQGGRTKRIGTRIQKIGGDFCRRVKGIFFFAMFVGGFKREYMLFTRRLSYEL